MDYRQSKLTKNEWISIEKPVDMKEKNVLDMIVKGYSNPDYNMNLHHVISDVVKLEHPEKDYYICKKCGYTVGDSAPDKCPVCGAKKDEFFIAD